LTTHTGHDDHARISPDGSLIAFTSERSGNRQIWIMPRRGGAPTQLTSDSSSNGWPAWSPDGKKIVFCSDRSGNLDLWVLDVPAELTSGP
jgi:TolB protein